MYEDLKARLLQDLQDAGVPLCFELCIKDYSKTLYGCYRTKTNRVYLYYWEDSAKTKHYTYEHLLEKAVHEAVHAQQWHDPSFIRVRGVMHDEEFYSLYEMYMTRIRKKVYYEEKDREVCGELRRSSEIHTRNHYNYRTAYSPGPVRCASYRRGL